MRRHAPLTRVAVVLGTALLVINGTFPLVWMMLTSLKDENELIRIPITYLPVEPTLRNYAQVFQNLPFDRFMLNSAIVAVTSTVVCVFIAALAGYALGRLNMPYRRALLTLIVTTSMFPALVLLVPLYRMFLGMDVPLLSPLVAALHDLGMRFMPTEVRTPNLLNTYWALIIPYVALSLPIATLILTSFFQLIPRDLESAALVDGCTRVQALFRVIAPVSAPGVVTAAIIIFVNSWNEFVLAMNFNTAMSMRTVPVGITMYQGEFAFPWATISAAITVGVLPLVALILVFQQKIIAGLTAGGVKG